jgi:D-lactate dehydrogenase
MKIAVFSTRSYDQESLTQAAKENKRFASCHHFEFFDVHLRKETVRMAEAYDAVCVFVNDQIDRSTLKLLRIGGVRLVALRCAGYNNVDLNAANELGITVVRVPAYSPEAVAEHTVALILALNRKIYRAHHRVREGNFSLEGLVGFNLHQKTVGLVGTGRIGRAVAQILGPGFGCHLLGFDPEPNEHCVELGLQYVTLPELVGQSDIVSLHAPLLPSTAYLINEATIAQMKTGVMLINTSRGALIDTKAVIEALKTGQLGGVAIDVYEQEANLFFRDLSSVVIADDLIQRLVSFPNVIVTGHQAFLTREALTTICETTLQSATAFEQGQTLENEINAP